MNSFDQTDGDQVAIDPVGLLATEVLKDLYRAVCGHEALAVRAYQDEDAILLLLRFDPLELDGGSSRESFGPPLDTAFLAMPGMIASAVEARTGRQLAPGNLSVCADRGLAVFAFSALEAPIEIAGDEDPFRIEPVATPTGHPHLRLAG